MTSSTAAWELLPPTLKSSLPVLYVWENFEGNADISIVCFQPRDAVAIQESAVRSDANLDLALVICPRAYTLDAI